HPETGTELPLSQTGVLHVKGPNVFIGYLAQPDRTREVLADEWFNTGDMVRFDDEGFIHIVGRLTRFSKIGGEMVPHATVEERVAEWLGVTSRERTPLAVVGVPDENKGEALVLLTTFPITPSK